MIRHVVMFRWKPDTADEDVDSVVARLQTMPELIPEIREYRFGADLGINDANWDFVVVADFETADDYLTYRDDPRHRALVAEAIGPHLEERASVQYEFALVARPPPSPGRESCHGTTPSGEREGAVAPSPGGEKASLLARRLQTRCGEAAQRARPNGESELASERVRSKPLRRRRRGGSPGGRR